MYITFFLEREQHLVRFSGTPRVDVTPESIALKAEDEIVSFLTKGRDDGPRRQL